MSKLSPTFKLMKLISKKKTCFNRVFNLVKTTCVLVYGSSFLARLFRSRANVITRCRRRCRRAKTTLMNPLLKKYLSYQHQTWNTCSP